LRSLLEGLLEICETFLPKGNGCDCFLVQGASFPQLSYSLEHNLIEFRVEAGKWGTLNARWTEPMPLRQPFVQMLGYELVVIQKWIVGVDALDFL
jgi:hypothetical protein